MRTGHPQPLPTMQNGKSWRRVFTLTASLALMAGPALPARAQIRIALLGEQTTHSYHRTNDPEYPLFLGEALDADFKVDTTKVHPNQGGFLEGGGTHYRVGNFGHPRGTVLDHAMENPRAVLRSDELKLAEAFAPQIVIVGPFGEHEALTHVSMDAFTPDLHRLLARIAAFPSRPRVFLALPLPHGDTDNDAGYRRIHTETAQVAREMKLPVIDLWTAFIGHKEYFQDDTHLTVPGRRELARIVAAAVTAK